MTDVTLDSGEIRDVSLSSALGERYLAYALSTIMARSLPDVRDGLKPVHRRLLYAMRQLKLDPKSGYKKSARVVGDVMGKFHPHGDQSIYDALVRLAQDFAVRYPLIDGQGNFGNVDGDNAAAMRYTEARLTRVAELLLLDIDDDTVDFRPTYDGEEKEPVVLPAAFPNLLANGAQGIAVGMATAIPPHNVAELCAAITLLIDKPDAGIDELVALVPGPDFPTGGILVEGAASIREAYATGKGAFRLRARWHQEDLGRGTWAVIVTEIPYQVQKSRLIEKIAELIEQKKLPLLEDVRDESTDVVRIVLVPRNRTVAPEMLMEGLFKLSDLETRAQLNMNVLDKGQMPRVMGLREVLQAFVDHRIEVVVRRANRRLSEIAHRLEILGGYLIAYLNLDEVIRIIREEDHPKPALMARFELTDVQAEAILNMRLRSLRKLEEFEIRKENEALLKERAGLERLVAEPARQRKAVAQGVAEIAREFGPATPLGKRRTSFADAPAVIDLPSTAFIEREPITVVCSAKGWLRALKGHVDTDADVRFKEGDHGRYLIKAETTDRLIVFATNGRFFTLGCDRLPGGRGHGEPVRLMVDLGNDQDIVAMFVHKPGSKLLLAASDGKGFIVAEDDVVAQTKAGKQIMTLGEGAEAAFCRRIEGDHVAVVGENRKLLVYPLADVPELARGRGVTLQKYKDGGLSDVTVFALAAGLSWPYGTGTRTETALADWIGPRGSAGRLAPRGFPKSNRFS
ncbi:DNA topoisomerase IV subunit A [Zavarzinia aquatilis]|uniref:DNA topoisomerase 4 subunit A n=1 Tax=Zavarzinia aquatilis TaxID=2211142 RepID=A0A317EHR7_9PROT|nr:DNA topoisomerase IV subunit A [Zavarzinia aquatilis]PWR25874.1 DNA topoisomerase IV subunit A [Zavarzinia aquatilis]